MFYKVNVAAIIANIAKRTDAAFGRMQNSRSRQTAAEVRSALSL